MTMITSPIGPEARRIQERNDSPPSTSAAPFVSPASWARATTGDIRTRTVRNARAATQRRQVNDIRRGSPRPSRTGLPLAHEPRPESSRLDSSLADRARSNNSADGLGDRSTGSSGGSEGPLRLEPDAGHLLEAG